MGVVADVKQFGLDAPPTADLYLPLRQMPAFQAPLLAARMFWVVRARDDPSRLTETVREAIHAIDPGVATSSARTLDAVWSAALGPRRTNVRLLQVFGAVAVVLCAIGVYGVAALSAKSRRRELAIRAALGATPRELTASTVRRELGPVIAGLAAGLAIALVSAPVFFGNPYDTDPRDVGTYIAVAAALFAVALVAGYVPLRQSAAVAPAEALNS